MKKLLDVYGVVEMVECQGALFTDVEIYNGTLLTDLLTPHVGKRIHIIIEDTNNEDKTGTKWEQIDALDEVR